MFEIRKTMLSLDEQGLILAGRVLLAKGAKAPAPVRPSRAYLAPPRAPFVIDMEAQAGRVLALLSVAYRQAIPNSVFGTLAKAAAHWNRGEASRAQIMLTHLGLAELDGDRLAKVCVAERQLDTGLIEAADILKRFNPAEPRDARGRWTTGGSGSGSANVSATNVSDDDEEEDDDDDDDDGQEDDDEDASSPAPASANSPSPLQSDSQSPMPGITPASYVPGENNVDTPGSQYSPDKEGFHYYTTENVVCSTQLQCTAQEIADYLSRFAVPGQNPGDPVHNMEPSIVYIPGTYDSVGTVISIVTNNGLTITNVTNPDHIFYDGIVTRSANLNPDGSWSIKTIGIGNNIIPGANVFNGLLGPDIFNQLDKAMARTITHDRGLR